MTNCRPGGRPRRRLRLRLCLESFSRHQPIRARRVDRPGRVLYKGAIYTIAQMPDGYLWLGTEFGLFRFDGVPSVRWEPPAGQRLPGTDVYALPAAHDGALWIGTFAGLVTWSGARLAPRPDFDGQFVTSLLQDNEGTVWAGTLASPAGRLCAMRSGGAQGYGGMASSAEACIPCMRTKQALSGSVPSLGFGDGNPVLPSDK